MSRRVHRGAALVLALSLLGAAPAEAWDPPGWRKAPPEVEASGGPAGIPLRWALRFYRATVSQVDGDRCPSHPTCSAYAQEAVARHGALLGSVLTANRLLSEADEAAFAPRIRVGGELRVYAPVADDLAFLRGPLDP